MPTEEGYDHLSLIEKLLNGKDDSGNIIGLNNPDSELSNTMEERLSDNKDYLGSMASWITEGSNLKNLFGTKSAGLEFIIKAKYRQAN